MLDNEFIVTQSNLDLAEKLGLTIRIEHDDCTECPREWANLGTLVTRPQYTGDEYYPNDCDIGSNPQETIENFFKYHELDPNQYLYLPVYKYEHSGVCFNTTGFSCPWDSGLFGFIYVSKADIRKEYGVKRITKTLKERVLGYLDNEIATYSQWASGDEIYYVAILDGSNEILDSCGSIYGDDGVNEFLADTLPSLAFTQTAEPALAKVA